MVADPTQTGGRLIVLSASHLLLPHSDPPTATLGRGGGGKVAAVYFAAKNPEMPTLVYFHGNADQIGWGAAYLGKLLSDLHGFGLSPLNPGVSICSTLHPTKSEEYGNYHEPSSTCAINSEPS